jgi:hypothetical protein
MVKTSTKKVLDTGDSIAGRENIVRLEFMRGFFTQASVPLLDVAVLIT